MGALSLAGFAGGRAPRLAPRAAAARGGLALALRAAVRAARRAAARAAPRLGPRAARLPPAPAAGRAARACSTASAGPCSWPAWGSSSPGSAAPWRCRRRARASCASRSSARRSSSELNEALPPSGPLLKALARFDPFPRDRRARRRRAAAEREDRARPRRARGRAAAWCRCSAPRAASACRAAAGWPRDGIVVTNAHVVAGQDDTTVQLGGEGERHGRRRDLVRPAQRPGDPARARPRAAPALPAERERRARAPRRRSSASRRTGRYDVRARAAWVRPRTVITQDAYGRGPGRSARSPRCAAGCARATRAARWSTAAGRVVTTIFAAGHGAAGGTGFGVPDSIVREALRRARGPWTPGPARADASS